MRLLIVPALCTLVFSAIIDRHPREPGFQIIYPILIVARACVNNVSLVALVAFAPTSTVSSTPFKSSPTPKLFAIAILLIVTRMNAVIAVGSIGGIAFATNVSTPLAEAWWILESAFLLPSTLRLPLSSVCPWISILLVLVFFVRGFLSFF